VLTRRRQGEHLPGGAQVGAVAGVADDGAEVGVVLRREGGDAHHLTGAVAFLGDGGGGGGGGGWPSRSAVSLTTASSMASTSLVFPAVLWRPFLGGVEPGGEAAVFEAAPERRGPQLRRPLPTPAPNRPPPISPPAGRHQFLIRRPPATPPNLARIVLGIGRGEAKIGGDAPPPRPSARGWPVAS
jgi:hypothetical protein